jgi:hypothetical protein
VEQLQPSPNTSQPMIAMETGIRSVTMATFAASTV